MVGRQRHQAGLPAESGGELHPGLGGRPHLERDQAALGRGAPGIHQRHVECRGFHHQLPLRGHHWTQDCRIL